jgi:hypothetical protein
MNVRFFTLAAMLLCLVSGSAQSLDYGYDTADPQKSGWPLTKEDEEDVI